VDLQAIRTSVDTRTKNLLETVTVTREYLHEDLGLMIQVETQMAKTLIDTTRRGLEAKITKKSKPGQSAGLVKEREPAQMPKLDGSISWAVIRRQFEIMAEHNGWKADDKTPYLIAALNNPAAHILHSVPTGAKYEEVTAVLENRYGYHHLEEAFHAQLRRRVQHAGESL
jgi:hypothetical protein